MRITPSMVIREITKNLNNRSETILTAQTQLATGKRINRPSDDPTGAAKILYKKSDIAQMEQYKDNIQNARDWLQSTGNTLTQIEDLLIEIYNVANEGKSELISAEVKDGLATQVDQYLQQMLGIANTQVGGKYIFGGTQTLTQPFTETTVAGEITQVDPNANGINGSLIRCISKDQTMTINTKGDALFQPNGVGASGDIFDVIIDLREYLQADDVSGIGTQITELESLIDSVAKENSIVGSKINRLDGIVARLDQEILNTKESLSDVEDTDFVQATLDYQTAYQSYQASLNVSSSLLKISLLNYL